MNGPKDDTADTEMAIRELARRHTTAMAERNLTEIEHIYAADAKIWHNTDRRTVDRAGHIASYTKNTAAIARIEYSDIQLNVFAGGFVQQHLITAHLHDGRSFEIACCIVARVKGGRIIRFDEYYDSAAFQTVGLKTEH